MSDCKWRDEIKECKECDASGRHAKTGRFVNRQPPFTHTLVAGAGPAYTLDDWAS